MKNIPQFKYQTCTSKICPCCKLELPIESFYLRNRGRDNEPISLCKSCHKNYYKQKTIVRKKALISLYGGKCECCGETNIEFLSIDHINNDGFIERRRVFGRDFYLELLESGYLRTDLRILCMNCNFSLGKYGYCPHKKELVNNV